MKSEIDINMEKKELEQLKDHCMRADLMDSSAVLKLIYRIEELEEELESAYKYHRTKEDVYLISSMGRQINLMQKALELVEKETNRAPLLTDGAIVMVRNALIKGVK